MWCVCGRERGKRGGVCKRVCRCWCWGPDPSDGNQLSISALLSFSNPHHLRWLDFLVLPPHPLLRFIILSSVLPRSCSSSFFLHQTTHLPLVQTLTSSPLSLFHSVIFPKSSYLSPFSSLSHFCPQNLLFLSLYSSHPNNPVLSLWAWPPSCSASAPSVLFSPSSNHFASAPTSFIFCLCLFVQVFGRCR